jgi:hypothetical protein
MTETAVDIAVDESEKVDYTKLIRMNRPVADSLSLQGLLSETEDLLKTDPKEALAILEEAQEVTYSLSEKIDDLVGNLHNALHNDENGIAIGGEQRPMDYQLVTASGASELAAAVDEQNSKGWNVSGGMVIGPDGSFYQPMVKHNNIMDW